MVKWFKFFQMQDWLVRKVQVGDDGGNGTDIWR